MRCLALAQSWLATGWQAIFVISEQASAISKRLQSENLQVIHVSTVLGSLRDAERTTEIAIKSGAQWVVLDGYDFETEYQLYLKQAGLRVLLIDDCGYTSHCFADIILNQNIHASDNLYQKRESDTRLLLGTNYVLLRKEFLKWQDWRRAIRDLGSKVLVTFGGTDPHKLTLKTLKALKKISMDNLHVVVVLGGNNSGHKELQPAIDELHAKIELKSNVTNMPELMVWADMGISAGGTTCWELAYMGLPSLVIIAAKNQFPVAESLAAASVVENLGWHADLSTQAISDALMGLLESSEKRLSMSQNGRKVLDGKGVARVRKFMLKKDIILRRVRRDDCALLWNWANEPAVRAVSFSSESIPWVEHLRWFESKLSDTSCFFFLAVAREGTPIGQIRFDSKEQTATVSVSIGKQFRGHGYGPVAIEMASRKLFEISQVNRINAYIRSDNKASKHAFIRAGYTQRGNLVMHAQTALCLVYDKDVENE